MFRGFRNQWPGRTIDPMASQSAIIATACEVVLDRRIRGDEAKIAAARERVGGTPADQAGAEFWAVWGIAVVEQIGADALRDVLERHRLAGVAR
jgi:hypothetical protein